MVKLFGLMLINTVRCGLDFEVCIVFIVPHDLFVVVSFLVRSVPR